MVLEEYREQADPYLNPIAAYFVRTHPNTMTWLAFVFAVLAALTFVATNFIGEWSTGALGLAASLIFLNAIFDALDGKVARLAKRESKRGDFLDHVLDRYADFFIIGGMTVSPFCDPRIGVLAILGVIFASYMGTQAQAVGVKRDYGGLLGRSDRLVLLIFLPLIQMSLEMLKLVGPTHHFPVTLSGVTVQLSVIELMLIWFAVAGNATAIQRAWSTWKELSRREMTGEGPARPPEASPGGKPQERPAREDAAPGAAKEELGWAKAQGILDNERLADRADMVKAVAEKLAEREALLTRMEAELKAREARLGEIENRQTGQVAGWEQAPRAKATGTPDIDETESGLEGGTLSLADATARLRSARLSIEKHMRDLKEKEIRLMKLEKRIERRRREARRQ